MSNNGALKFDNNKPDHSLVSKTVMDSIARGLGYGVKKYGRDNYKKGMEILRITASLSRHTKALEAGEDIDPDSGLHHADLIASNAAMLTELVHDGYGTDNRYKREVK